MTNNSDGSDDYDDASQSASPNAKEIECESSAVVAEGLCPCCGYDLRGLAKSGTCPECGKAYTSESLLLLRRIPGALELWARFGWPLVALIASFTHPLTSRDPYAFVGWLFIAMLILLAMLANAAVQAVWLAHACVRPEARERRFSERLRMLGPLAVTLYTITLVGPMVIVGGCVALVCAGTMG